MLSSAVAPQEKNTFQITVDLPNSALKEEYEKVIKKIVEDFETPGFRKGKAPRDLVEKNIDRQKVASIIIQNILPKAYQDAVREHNLHPVVDPKVYIDSPKNIEEILGSADLKIRITIAEAPKVDLKDYKEKIKGESAKSKIWTPEKGKEETKKEESKEEADQKKFVSMIDTILKTCSVNLSDMIVESETNRLLSQTLEEIKKLGLSLEEYLKNTGKTAEALQAEAKEKAGNNLRLEFIFNEIAKVENLTVEKADIDRVLAEVKDPKQKAEAEQNAYRIAPILLRQKVVDFLMKL